MQRAVSGPPPFVAARTTCCRIFLRLPSYTHIHVDAWTRTLTEAAWAVSLSFKEDLFCPLAIDIPVAVATLPCLGVGRGVGLTTYAFLCAMHWIRVRHALIFIHSDSRLLSLCAIQSKPRNQFLCGIHSHALTQILNFSFCAKFMHVHSLTSCAPFTHTHSLRFSNFHPHRSFQKGREREIER